MHYKTIVLELLQDEAHQTLHEKLRVNRKLLEAVNTLATHLKARHEFWMRKLSQSRQAFELSQHSSSALEMAVQELRDALPAEKTYDPSDTLNLADATSFISRFSPSR
jgi:hypothetical protein